MTRPRTVPSRDRGGAQRCGRAGGRGLDTVPGQGATGRALDLVEPAALPLRIPSRKAAPVLGRADGRGESSHASGPALRRGPEARSARRRGFRRPRCWRTGSHEGPAGRIGADRAVTCGRPHRTAVPASVVMDRVRGPARRGRGAKRRRSPRAGLARTRAGARADGQGGPPRSGGRVT